MKILDYTMCLDDYIKTYDIVLIQFGSSACTPCSAIYEKLDTQLQVHKEVYGIYIPIEQFLEEAAKKNVFSVPTLVLYVHGKFTIKESGFFSLEKFLSRVEKYISFMSESTIFID